MPAKPVEAKRVVLNTLIAPGTREEIARRVAATKKSQGVVIDEAVAGGSVETGECGHEVEISGLRSEHEAWTTQLTHAMARLEAAEERAGVLGGMTSEALVLIRAESGRLTEELGRPVNGADVIEMAVVKWCSVDSDPMKCRELPEMKSSPEFNREVARRAIAMATGQVEGSESDVADFRASDETKNQAMGLDDRREAAEAAMRGAESGSAAVPPAKKVNKGTESVAQRRAREAREHAAELAESDVLAKLTGRTDIDYDLDNVPHRSVALSPVVQGVAPEPLILREPTVKREFKPLVRPHGKTEAKRRRE